MKVKSIIAALFLMGTGLQTVCAQKMIVRTKDNQTTEFSIPQLEEVIFEEEVRKLELSNQAVSLEKNKSTTVLVTSGNGTYTAKSSNTYIVSATVNKARIIITGIDAGLAFITVTDTKTGEEATIEVTVTDGCILSDIEMGLPVSTIVSPDIQWKADIMVFNGERYDDNIDYLYWYSNLIIGTPPSDAQGNKWYARNYQLTNSEKSWSAGISPFTAWTSYWYMADIYLRRYFIVNHEISDKIIFSCSHDDAPAEWYLNGVLIRSIEDGCAQHDEDYVSWTWDESTYLTPDQRALIYTDGRVNVLAIHVHNNWGGALADGGLYEE